MQEDVPTLREDQDLQDDLIKLKRWYAEEIARKDRVIDELRKENILLVRSQLKLSERLSEMQGLRSSTPGSLEKVRIAAPDEKKRDSQDDLTDKAR